MKEEDFDNLVNFAYGQKIAENVAIRNPKIITIVGNEEAIIIANTKPEAVKAHEDFKKAKEYWDKRLKDEPEKTIWNLLMPR